MKITLSLLLSIVVAIQFSTAQKIVDVKADYVLFYKGDIVLYQEVDKDNYNEIEFEINFDGQQPGKIILIKNLVSKNEIPKKAINVGSLTKMSVEKLLSKVRGEIYFRKEGRSYPRNNYVYALHYSKNNVIKSYGFVYRDESSSDSIQELSKWEVIDDRIIYNNFVIRINNEYPLISIIENVPNPYTLGYIRPKEEGEEVYFDELYFKREAIPGFSSPTKEYFKNLVKLNGNKVPLYYYDYTFDISGNYIRDVVFQQVLVPQEFDTLYFHDYNIIGKKDQKIFMYNLSLESLVNDDVRAIYRIEHSEISQLLKGNDLMYLNADGSLDDKRKEIWTSVCGTVPYYSRDLIETADSIVLEEHRKEVGGSYNLEFSIPLFRKNTYDKITFINNDSTQSFDGNDLIMEDYTLFDLLIVEKDAKKGLIRYTINEHSKPEDSNEWTVELETVFPLMLDEIETFGFYHPPMIKKDGLLGYFGLNDHPKYKVLAEFQDNFARFTMPDGTQGWLDLQGNEYIDK